VKGDIEARVSRIGGVSTLSGRLFVQVRSWLEGSRAVTRSEHCSGAIYTLFQLPVKVRDRGF